MAVYNKTIKFVTVAKSVVCTGCYAGVDAYSVTCDEDVGEYGDPVFHVWLGRVRTMWSDLW